MRAGRLSKCGTLSRSSACRHGSGSTPAKSSSGIQGSLATGDAVNVAARLEQAAQPGEILIGAKTFALVGDTAEVEALEPLELKGKSKPVPAFRLAAITGSYERRHENRFVGRGAELRGAAARVASGARRSAVRADNRPRRRRSRQVATDDRVPLLGRSSRSSRPLRPVRRGNHLLAGGRGSEATGRTAVGSRPPPRRSARCSARPSTRRRRRRSPGRSAGRSKSRLLWWSSSTTSTGARRRSST